MCGHVFSVVMLDKRLIGGFSIVICKYKANSKQIAWRLGKLLWTSRKHLTRSPHGPRTTALSQIKIFYCLHPRPNILQKYFTDEHFLFRFNWL